MVTGFAGAALEAQGNAAAWLAEGGSELRGAILHGNAGGGSQLASGIARHVEYEVIDPWLRDIRFAANLDPRPRSGWTAPHGETASRLEAGGAERDEYTGAFGGENWLEEWTVFGPESGTTARRSADRRAGGRARRTRLGTPFQRARAMPRTRPATPRPR